MKEKKFIEKFDVNIYIYILLISFILSILLFLGGAVEQRYVMSISDSHYRLYIAMRMFAFALSMAIFYKIILVVCNVIKNEKREKSIFFFTYLILNCFILIFVWPGIFKGDEFYIIPEIVNDLHLVPKQSIFTSVFYQIALMIFPILASITFLQIFIISVIAERIFAIIQELVSHKHIAWFLLLPLVLFPVLDNNLFTLRTSQIAWVFADAIVTLIYMIKREQFCNTCEIIRISILVSFMFALKNEYIFAIGWWVLSGLIYFFIRKIDFKNLAILLIVTVVSAGIFSYPSLIFKTADKYKMTSIITPLAYVLNVNYDELDELPSNYKESLSIIDKYSPIDDLANSITENNLPVAYWYLPEYSADEVNEWMLAAIKICFYYKDDFIANQIQRYKYTNGMVPNVINHTGWEDSNITLNLYYSGTYFFKDHFKKTDPLLGYDVRQKAISLLNCRDYQNYTQTNHLYPILYNSLIPLIFLIVIAFSLVVSKIKGKYQYLWLGMLLLASLIINFLFSPATFWMYYMPFYLSAYIVVMIYVICVVDKRCGELVNGDNL